MAHKILPDLPKKKEKKLKKALVKLKSQLSKGNYGFTLQLGSKEVFLGIILREIIVEPIRRKKVVKSKKGTAEFFPVG